MCFGHSSVTSAQKFAAYSGIQLHGLALFTQILLVLFVLHITVYRDHSKHGQMRLKECGLTTL